MRKLNLITIIAVCLLLPLSLMAQNTSIKKLMDKYKGKEGFTSVNISKDLLEMASGRGMHGRHGGDSAAMAEREEMLSKINSVTILTYENNKDADEKPKKPKKAAIQDEFYNDIVKTFPIETYKELLSVDGSDKTVKIVYKNEGKDNGELLVIVNDVDNTTLIHIDGAIDPKSLGSMGKLMPLGELRGLIGMQPPIPPPDVPGPDGKGPRGKMMQKKHHVMPRHLPPPPVGEEPPPPDQNQKQDEKKGE